MTRDARFAVLLRAVLFGVWFVVFFSRDYDQFGSLF